MKALITGASGMLGDSLCRELAGRGYDFLATDIDCGRGEACLDITDRGGIKSVFDKFRPRIVFHLAAMTNVDECQQKQARAYAVNARGTENIASACAGRGIEMVYISSGAVFDGKKGAPYNELDNPNPINIYGASKLEGERAVRRILHKHFIVRSGWLIGGIEKDKKFVYKIVKQLTEQKEIMAVTDKIGSPTFTKDLSLGVVNLAETKKYGTYHLANKGACSRYEIAGKVAEFMEKDIRMVRPVTSDVFKLAAPRPDCEAVESSKLNLLGMDDMRFWQDALKEYILMIKHSDKMTPVK